MWIKRVEYEDLKKVRSRYIDVMKGIHNAEKGNVAYCNFGVFMPNSVHEYYCDLVASLKKEINDLKEKNIRSTSKPRIL